MIFSRISAFKSILGCASVSLFILNAKTGKESGSKCFNENIGFLQKVYAHNEHHVYYEDQFRKYASITHKGTLYMTGTSFLDFMVSKPPGEDSKLKSLDQSEFNKRILSIDKSSLLSMRKLKDNWLLSYPEYIFLLSVLSNSPHTYEIAFKMLDRDMSHTIDSEEFTRLNKVVGIGIDTHNETHTHSTHLIPHNGDKCPSTLMLYFFGPEGKQTLSLQKFKKFIESFFEEALEVEFYYYSDGNSRLPKSQFARNLLKYTNLSEEKIKETASHLGTIDDALGYLSLEEYKSFFIMLKSIDDLALALKMYAVCDRPLTNLELKRAVKAVTGKELTDNLMDTIMVLFDKDGDQHLSHKEFVSMAKGRCAHGLVDHSPRQIVKTRWAKFKSCVVQELKEQV